MTRFTGPALALALTVGFLLGLVAAGTRPDAGAGTWPVRPRLTEPLALDPGPRALPAAGRTDLPAHVDFAVVAARLNAAVVNVEAASRGSARSQSAAPRWSRDVGDDATTPREGSGSGFIIDERGYVLTNYHVIENADRITLSLSDKRVFRADVVGVDPAIDVALLKIPGAERLPVAPLGNSDTLQAGEWVCAIGNPLGYVHSVTVGVVSFLGRKLFDQSLDAFIQTDAAIAFGNSGGPLINARGEVVGITTAISSQSSSIGFAIPINQVVAVLSQLQEHGRVSRGYIGVTLTNVTPPLRAALGIGPADGALVQDVTAGRPGERAGLRPYDVVVKVDDQEVESDEDLIRYISGRLPGTVADLTYWRNGATRSVPVRLGERPLPDSARRDAAPPGVRPAAGRQYGPLGITFRDLDRNTAVRNRIPDGLRGVIVTYVDPAGPARLARVRAGQVILEVNRKPVLSAAEFSRALAALNPGDAAAVLLFDPHPNVEGRVIAVIIADPMP